jgi:ubiquinone biosynthesis protein
MLLTAMRIAAIVAAHGVAYGIRSSTIAADADVSEIRYSQGEALASLLERLGPTYVKLGQVLSTRPDVLGVHLAGGLARLQERVQPVSPETALIALREGLGDRLIGRISWVDPTPIASGSIAQVHRAMMTDGREVAVKIRRPGIVRRIDSDARFLIGTAKLATRFGLQFPVVPWLQQFIDAVRAQLDLQREGQNYRDLRTNLAHIRGIRIPEVVFELTTQSVLTMEFIGDLHHVDRMDLPCDPRQRALRVGLEALYQMIFIDGVVHADLHPGNVFFLRSGECVLLDAGVVARLDVPVRRDFVDFFFGLVTDRGVDCARIIHDNALYRSPSLNRTAFDSDVSAVVSRFAALRARDFEVTSFAAALFGVQHRHEVYGSPDFMMAIVALLTYEGIVKRVQPDMDFQSIAHDVLLRARKMSA